MGHAAPVKLGGPGKGVGVSQLWVALLVGAILGLQAIFWIVFAIWFRNKRRALLVSMQHELLASGETAIRGPEGALYAGANRGFPGSSGNGLILLTRQRLVFCKVTGGRIEVPLEQVAAIREATWFRRSYRSGRQHLILQLQDGNEVGFIVADHPGWLDAMRQAVAR